MFAGHTFRHVVSHVSTVMSVDLRAGRSCTVWGGSVIATMSRASGVLAAPAGAPRGAPGRHEVPPRGQFYVMSGQQGVRPTDRPSRPKAQRSARSPPPPRAAAEQCLNTRHVPPPVCAPSCVVSVSRRRRRGGERRRSREMSLAVRCRRPVLSVLDTAQIHCFPCIVGCVWMPTDERGVVGHMHLEE